MLIKRWRGVVRRALHYRLLFIILIISFTDQTSDEAANYRKLEHIHSKLNDFVA